MHSEAKPAAWKILLAFGIIYFVWGSTFFAIRVGVAEVPPFLLAAMRFFIAGLVLFLWMLAKKTPLPSRREWAGITLLGALIFLVDYGCLFWAEKRIPSGIAAVILACIPVFMTLLEIILLKTQRLTIRLTVALAIGVFGVAVLMNRSLSLGEAPVNRAGAIALVFAAFSWSIAAILARSLTLPTSKPMSSATQLLVGGTLLFAWAAASGEFSGFHFSAVSTRAWIALAYLIVFGSIMGFTAYVWLLHHESPTKVGTYAYVNPVVAVGLGYFAGGEAIGARTLLGTALILVSVVLITTTPKVPARAPESDEVVAAESQ